MSVAIFRAHPDDAPALVAMMRDFYAESAYPLDEVAAHSSFRLLITEERLGAVFLAKSGEDYIGYLVISLRYSIGRSGYEAVLDDLFVHQKARRQGIGRRLVQCALDYCRNQGVRAISLETAAGESPAGYLYRSCGFQENSLTHLIREL